MAAREHDKVAVPLAHNERRIALLGGSLDPPHFGHLAMAEAALRVACLMEVVLAPTGRQPFKKEGAAASFGDRLQMTQLLCAADPAHLRASALDAPDANGSPNYTVDTLERFAAEEPGARHFGVLGADSLLQMTHWREPQRLMELAEWIVISRPGSPLPDPLPAPLRPDRIWQVNDVAIPLASHVLRERLAAGEPCDDAIPEKVLAYIRARGLYGTRRDLRGEG